MIEIDMLGRSQPIQGSFLGVAFRVVDAQTHDAVSLGLFNFWGGRRGAAQSRRTVCLPSALALANPPIRAPRRVREGRGS
jgi:hypothetical protein